MATKTSHRRKQTRQAKKAAAALRQLNAEAAQLLDARAVSR